MLAVVEDQVPPSPLVSILYWGMPAVGMAADQKDDIKVSILYWRCTVRIVTARDGKEVLVSILYWRCRYTCRRGILWLKSARFNSLLEMPHPLTAALAVAATALWFQFSI